MTEQVIKVVTFDLDNTLWDVEPVLLRAEQAQYRWLEENRPRVTREFDAAGFADGDNHVTTVGEGKDRVIDAEFFTEFIAHGYGSTALQSASVSGGSGGPAMTVECQPNWRFVTAVAAGSPE